MTDEQKQDNKIEFLNIVHNINERADIAIERCDAVLRTPTVPDSVKLWFIETKAALELQKTLISKLMMSQLEFEDSLDDLMKKIKKDNPNL